MPRVSTILKRESEFSIPSEFCPHPEHWTAFDPSSAEVEVSEFIFSLIRMMQPEFIIETGTCFGQTTEYIGRALKENSHGKCVSLEINEAMVEYARKRCVDLPVEVILESSLDYTTDETIDFAWFDSLPAIRFDEFIKFLPNFSKGAIVCFHDTAPHFSTQYVDKLYDYGNVINFKTPRGLTIVQVNNE